MRLIYADSPQDGQEELFNLLRTSLKNNRVLWLLSGGSNIEVEVAILNEIEKELTANLAMMLADERYGPSGHGNSNYQKLISSGLNVRHARFIDILKDSSSAEESLAKFKQEYAQLRKSADIIIGQLGIGDNGHIAGVMPSSLGVRSKETAVYYEANDHRRITLTLQSLKDFHHTYVFCFGEDKKPALDNIKRAKVSLDQCPSLILREMPDAKVYNDQIKESS